MRVSCFDVEGVVEDRNVIGVVPNAATQWDTYDRSDPPMNPGKALSLYFPHATWEKNPGSYAVDIRGAYGKIDAAVLPSSFDGDLCGHLWRFDVAKNFSDGTAGDELVLDVSDVESIPAAAEILLVDRDLQREIDLRKTDRYTFFLGRKTVVTHEEACRFVLLVGNFCYDNYLFSSIF